MSGNPTVPRGGKHIVQLDLPNGCRVARGCWVRDVHRNDAGRVVGTVTLWEREFFVRRLDNLDQWRIVDDRGEYLRIEFPEAVPYFDHSRARRRSPAAEVVNA